MSSEKCFFMKNNNGDQKGLRYLFIIHVCFPFELWYEYLHLIYTFLSEHDGIIIQKKYKISKDVRTLWISRLWIMRRDGNACSMLLVLIFLPNNVGMASTFKTALLEISSCHFVLVVNVNKLSLSCYFRVHSNELLSIPILSTESHEPICF